MYLIFLFEESATLVNYLISKGADVSIQDECGRTPLFLASELGNWDVVEPVINADQFVDTRYVTESFLNVIDTNKLKVCHHHQIHLGFVMSHS